METRPKGLRKDPERRANIPKEHPAEAKQVAEKPRRTSEEPEKHPPGAKARRFLSCIYGTTEVVPFQKMGYTRAFPHSVKPIFLLCCLRHG
jgi:hypothetical protein